jgi:hypothetical protein
MASAQPAPPLTDLQFVGITSDGDDYEWYDVPDNQTNIDYTASGSEVVVAIYVEGTTRGSSPWMRFRGENIHPQTYERYPREYLSGPDRIIYGHIRYVAIPIEAVADNETGTSGMVTAQAMDYYAPLTYLYAQLNFHIEPR